MTARPARPPSSPTNYPLSTGMHGFAMPRLQMPFWIESCKGIIASHARVTPCARDQNQTKAAQTRSILTDTTSIKPHNAKPLQTGHDRQKDRSWSPEHATLIYSMAQKYTHRLGRCTQAACFNMLERHYSMFTAKLATGQLA